MGNSRRLGFRLGLFVLCLFGSILSTLHLPAQSQFRRGDAGGDGSVDPDDAVFIQDWLFAFGPPPPCMDAADANDDGVVDNQDAVFILAWDTVAGSPPPPLPGPDRCGDDPTADLLGCGTYACDFIRGDANLDGFIDGDDVQVINDFLFAGGSLACEDAADVEDDGDVDVSDALALGNFLTSGIPLPPAPGPIARSFDPTPDSLDCQQGLTTVPFLRGDADGDGDVDSDDGQRITDFLFATGVIECLDAADANDDGVVDLQDATYVLNFTDAGGPAPPAPGAFICGQDPTADALGCNAAPCTFIRGDANGDGSVDLDDVDRIEDFLFFAGPPFDCEDAADTDDDGTVNQTDAIFLLSAIFTCATLPPHPGPHVPSVDLTVDTMKCASYTVRPPVDFQRGDCNVDGAFDVADPITLLGYLFPMGIPAPPDCADACDANDDGCLDIADPINMLMTLFPGTPFPSPLPYPYQECGLDPTPEDILGCREYTGHGCP